jgi:hypothetical protein
MNRPRQVATQRASARRFADPKVPSLCHALLAFPQLPGGSSNRHRRERFAALIGQPQAPWPPGKRPTACDGINSSSASPARIITGRPTWACASPCSSLGSETESSAPVWAEYFPLSPTPPARCDAPSTNSTGRSQHGSNKPNSLVENLTHLHCVSHFKISRPSMIQGRPLASSFQKVRSAAGSERHYPTGAASPAEPKDRPTRRECESRLNLELMYRSTLGVGAVSQGF